MAIVHVRLLYVQVDIVVVGITASPKMPHAVILAMENGANLVQFAIMVGVSIGRLMDLASGIQLATLEGHPCHPVILMLSLMVLVSMVSLLMSLMSLMSLLSLISLLMISSDPYQWATPTNGPP